MTHNKTDQDVPQNPPKEVVFHFRFGEGMTPARIEAFLRELDRLSGDMDVSIQIESTGRRL